MKQYLEEIEVRTDHRELYEITEAVRNAVAESQISTGLLTAFIKHTSASLLVQENADPSVLRDLEQFLARLVPEDHTYLHTGEGPEDMPSHIKCALTQSSIQVPICDGNLDLGRWQGIFLWEHRGDGRRRKIVLHLLGE